MGFLGNVMNAAGSALYAFRESMLNADPQGRKASLDFGVWDRWEARLTRYDLLWSLYQNNAYRDLVHPWAPRYKTAYGMYKHCRHLYNPAYRLGEFWAGHLMPGSLDLEAGDGEDAQSALPILTDNETLRPAIAKIWKDSRWQQGKEKYARFGSVLGDVILKGVDDQKRQQVRMEVVHPGHLKWMDCDEMGNVKAYIIQRWMYDPRELNIADLNPIIDPRAKQRPVIFREKCFRDGDDVVFQTSLNDQPYALNGVPAERVEKYGFVPMVVARHEDVGMDWGACCFHAGLERFREVDDQASGLSDQIRKAIRAPMLLSGVPAPRGRQLKTAGTDRSQQPAETVANNPEPERTETEFLHAPEGATATHMTFNLDIEGVIAHIEALNRDIEKNYPEMLADTGNLGGTVTAEAIRNARQQASGKAQSRRPNYDNPLVAMHEMLISIGGFRGYEGYQGFDLDSFSSGKLDHRIGHRAVFEVDPLDSINEDTAFFGMIAQGVTAGIPLEVMLERNGWSKEDLDALGKAKATEDQKAMDTAAAMAEIDKPPVGATK